MVLPASSPDIESSAHLVAPWIERIAKHLRHIRLSTLVLVDHAHDSQLGPLVRGLSLDFPDLWVVTEAARIEDAPEGAVVVLVARPEDAIWLNLNRPIFADRALKVVLWSKRVVSEHFAKKAPDFFNWIARHFDCPDEPPTFAIHGMRSALRARAWAVDFRGKTLDAVFAAAFPKRKLLRLSASAPEQALRTAVKEAGTAWITWTNLFDEQGIKRVRQIVTNEHRKGRNILENVRGTAHEAWPVFDALMSVGQAIGALEQAGLPAAGRLAAMLDLEPEAIAFAADELERGITVAEIEAAIRTATDPGAALEKQSAEAAKFDAVQLAAFRAPPPMLRAFALDPRVREARAVMVARTGPKLPPLTERIMGGGAEFERLMGQLWQIHPGTLAQYMEWRPFEYGYDVLMPEGLPGMTGYTAVSFYWQAADQDKMDFDIEFNADRMGFKHWILVASREFTASERAQLDAMQVEKSFQIHTWGQTEIENLLRKCPSLFARYYPEEARAYLPGYDGTDFGTLATQYREKIGHHYNRLKTIGIPPEARPRESRIELPLTKLFIPLCFFPEENHTQSVTLSRAIKDSWNAVVRADPGMGKSTLLAYLALLAAGQDNLEGFTASRLVPMPISLRDFVRRQKQTPGLSFLDYLEVDARERFLLPNMHRAFFEATLRMGEAFVLLDGLDEVGNETARHALAASIRAFAAEYPESRFWVTSRIYGYTENVRLPKTFDHYQITRLDEAQIDDFVRRWYSIQVGSEQEAKEQAASLQAAIRRAPGVKRLAGNPLLLTLMAFIHQGLRRLPKDRGELYDKCLEMLLKTWEEAKVSEGENPRNISGLALNVATQKDYLAHLAFFIQQKNQSGKDEESRGLISRREAIEALARRHLGRARRERPELTEIEAAEEMKDFLEAICEFTGLLLDRGNDQISFIHLSFQEYLAAWVFRCGTELAQGSEFFLQHLGDPAWEEVLLLRLYIVLWGGGGGEGAFDQIVAAIRRSLERKDNPEGWLMLVRAIRDDLEFTESDRREILKRALGYWREKPALSGTWFEALFDVHEFGTRAREVLHDVITGARTHARKPAEASGLLRMETMFFDFPDDAADWLQKRPDLAEMLPDLVHIIGQPSVLDILAKHATITDWARGLHDEHPLVSYQLTLDWIENPPSVAALEGGTAFLWRTINLELAKRAIRWANERMTSNATPALDDLHAQNVQRTASSWEERFRSFNVTSASMAALVISHAAYATLITGNECKIPFVPDRNDARVRMSISYYEECCNPNENSHSLLNTIADPPAELRSMLEAADVIRPAILVSVVGGPTVTTASAVRTEEPNTKNIFSWIHLSDMHFGHPNISHQWDQRLVLDSLHRDIERLEERKIPKPEVLLVTGDIAFSGNAEQYAEARVWLDKVAGTLGISREHVYLVPGNHDVDRTVDRKDRNVARLIRGLRDGDDLLDDVLDNADDRGLLASRMSAYLAFASQYPSVQAPDPLFWTNSFVSAQGLPIRIIGLPTALLAAGDVDRGKLRLGKKPLASTLNEAHPDRELVLVLTHHPFRGGWLVDQADVDNWVRNRGHVHLSGHVHEADSEMARSGSGSGILRIAAGAVHGDVLPPGVPAGHGYAFGAVIADANGHLRVRIWPRLWSGLNKEFRADMHNVPDGQTYAEHSLGGRLRFAATKQA